MLAGIHPINCCRILAAASQATSTMYEVVGCTVPKISDLISLLIVWFSQFIKKVRRKIPFFERKRAVIIFTSLTRFRNNDLIVP